jgi:hypothetical protein
VRLAEEGASAREHRDRIAAVAATRRAAVEDVGSVHTRNFPTPEELAEAMRSGRRED